MNFEEPGAHNKHEPASHSSKKPSRQESVGKLTRGSRALDRFNSLVESARQTPDFVGLEDMRRLSGDLIS